MSQRRKHFKTAINDTKKAKKYKIKFLIFQSKYNRVATVHLSDIFLFYVVLYREIIK